MNPSPDDAELFFKLYSSLMHFVNQQLHVVPEMGSPEAFLALPPDEKLKVRKSFLDNLDLIERFAEENPAHLNDGEMEIVLSWRHHVSGQFYVFRRLKKCTVFLTRDEPPVAYGVVALGEPFECTIGLSLPVMTETMLLPFKGNIVYDGLLSSYNISFGPGIKRMLNDSYREAKERLGIVMSLPIESIPMASKKTVRKRKPRKATRSASKDANPVLDSIVEICNEFCRGRLNEEYAELCRKLAEKLSRKRPSPLLRGRPTTWACGIIRTIGWVNFLDDRTTQPYIKLTEIDKALGVGESTGQGKSAAIRRLLKIQPFDVAWTLPSQMDDNPLIWILEFNGFPIDVRHAPRELQEIAFEQGLIPYIPTVRKADPVRKAGLIRKKGSVKSGDGHHPLYQFKITLKGSEPAIWRRIQVEDCTLEELHEHIQTSMGWTNSHLHQFEIHGKRYGDPELLDDGFMDFDCVDSTVTRISDIVPAHGKPFRFRYEYDFGDGWDHEVRFEGCPKSVPGERYPLCVEGERACPPEDIGGVWGYGDYLEALANPDHERHEELLEWIGPFDPDAFDAAEATRLMRQGLPAWR